MHSFKIFSTVWQSGVWTTPSLIHSRLHLQEHLSGGHSVTLRLGFLAPSSNVEFISLHALHASAWSACRLINCFYLQLHKLPFFLVWPFHSGVDCAHAWLKHLSNKQPAYTRCLPVTLLQPLGNARSFSPTDNCDCLDFDLPRNAPHRWRERENTEVDFSVSLSEGPGNKRALNIF